MAIETQSVRIPGAEAEFGGYLARPEGAEARPAVLVFMEIFGINAYIRGVVERIAAQGYVALAPDTFHRTGPGMELTYDETGLVEGRKHLAALKAHQVLQDVGAALDFLDARDDVTAGRGAVGFCIGGHVAYLAATTGRLAATASFYGGGLAAAHGLGGSPAPAPLSLADGLQGRLLCLFGAQDPLIPPADVQAVEQALGAAGVDGEVHVYDGATHGFFCDQRDSYDPVASEDAWRRVTRLFSENL